MAADTQAQISVNRGTASLVAYGFAGGPLSGGTAQFTDYDTGLFSPAANQCALAAGGTAYLTVSSSGVTLAGGLNVSSTGATTPAILDNGTIATVKTVTKVTPAAAKTGIIMQAGTVDGQVCTVINNGAGASTLTMATAATSNVADGASCIIAGLTAMTFVWDSTAARWFRSAGTNGA